MEGGDPPVAGANEEVVMGSAPASEPVLDAPTLDNSVACAPPEDYVDKDDAAAAPVIADDVAKTEDVATAVEETAAQEEIGPSGPKAPTEPAKFMRELETFFEERNVEFKIPKFYGAEVDLFKLWTVVSSLGGYEQVTLGKLWRVVGDNFDPPKSCTTLSWSFRGFYEKALLDYEKYIGVDNLGEPGGAGPSARVSPAEGAGSRLARRVAATRAMGAFRGERGEAAGAEGEDITESRGVGTPTPKRQRRSGETVFGEDALDADNGGAGPTFSVGAMSAAVPGRGRYLQTNGREASVDVRRGKLEEAAAIVSDEGPPADWVRINVRRSNDCFEIYALVPGLLREEVRVQCEGGGKLVIQGEPEQPENPWGVTPFRKVILLPNNINPHRTSAVVTLHGQLYVRAPFASAQGDLVGGPAPEAPLPGVPPPGVLEQPNSF